MKLNKEYKRKRIHYRIRNKIKGSMMKPRLAVFRSNKFIYVQVIDDLSGHTLAAASSREDAVPKNVNKTEQARAVGKLIADRMLSQNIDSAVFDRGGFLYHGRVKALADGAREKGIKF